MAQVHYFSALAHHVEARRPGTVKRHETYIRALKSTGVTVELSSFKEKHIRFVRPREINVDIVRHEEKETDVAVGTRLVECALDPDCGSIVLVSGDSDIAPAIIAARKLAPRKPVFALFPVRCSQYALFQLSDPIVTPAGSVVRKPSDWA